MHPSLIGSLPKLKLVRVAAGELGDVSKSEEHQEDRNKPQIEVHKKHRLVPRSAAFHIVGGFGGRVRGFAGMGF